MFTKIKFIAIILFFSVAGLAQADYQIEYVQRHKDIAIKEMERAGIPASIKLAQALLESDAGRSELARKANNHFGIKCGNDWTGKTYHQKDDDYDDQGKLMESCFRSYKKDEESFIAHSEFLRDPKKFYRYGFLFRIDPTDYKKWAKGLREAGYATSATYDRKLIDIIERFNLHQYDLVAMPGDVVVTFPEDDPFQDDDEVGTIPSTGNPPTSTPTRPGTSRPGTQVVVTTILVVNDVKMVQAGANETVASIAKRTDTPVSSLIRYNEGILSADEVLKAGTRVYLQQKRDSYRERDKFHQVKANETMYDISQLYAVQMSELYKRNNMEFGTQPAVGEKIQLRGKRKDSPKLRAKEVLPVPTPKPPTPSTPVVVTDDKDDVFTPNEPVVVEKPKPAPVTPAPVPTNPKPSTPNQSGWEDDGDVIMLPPQGGSIAQADAEAHVGTGTSTRPTPNTGTGTVNTETKTYYTVQAGDTLYSISRKYNTTVDTIQRLNSMTSTSLSVGQRLRVQ